MALAARRRTVGTIGLLGVAQRESACGNDAVRDAVRGGSWVLGLLCFAWLDEGRGALPFVQSDRTCEE